MSADELSLTLAKRLGKYQSERFPLLRHAPAVAAFASSSVCLSALLGDRREWPTAAMGLAFIVSLGCFLLLRIADEFKDAKADAQFRPERAVPRGLVSLRLLALVGAGTAAAMAAITSSWNSGLLPLLAGVWVYMALMAREFFAPSWLARHPLLYMVSHMLVMPLIAGFSMACEWWPGVPPAGAAAVLALAFANGVVIEVGRKTWSQDMERPGVDSYSSAWGLARALAAWLLAAALAMAFALDLAYRVQFFYPVAALVVLFAALISAQARSFLKRPNPLAAQRTELLSAVWVLTSYLVLGVIAFALT